MMSSKIISAATAFLLFASASVVNAAPAVNGFPFNNCPGGGDPAPVPEPSGITALCIGMLAMGLVVAFRAIKRANSARS
jgi:hypothetical protein